MQIPFATQAYKSRSLPVSAQRCVNYYAENQQPGAYGPIALFGIPGTMSFATVGVGPIRGMWNMAGVLYVVSGGQLYSVSSTGVATALGGTISGSGVVSMADNGTQLCIVNGDRGYIYSVTGGFQLITSTNFHGANTVSFFDNYFVFNWPDTNQFYISASLDGTTFAALDYASAEVNPDYVVGVLNQQENLLVFGQETIETWHNSGDVNFPFSRYDGATVERGCIASLTILKEDNSVFFLGNDKIFYRLNGVIPVRISTHAIEHEWSNFADISDAFCYSHTWEGHKFIVLTFPIGNKTFVYDISTNLWQERISYDENYVSLGRWRSNAFCICYDKQLVGDVFSGRIGYLDGSTYTEYGNPIVGTMVNPILQDDIKNIFMSRFELYVQNGNGLTTGQGSDPQVMVDWSNDGGRTFTSQQPWNSSGRIGEYMTRLRWLNLGTARNRVMRVTISDPVPKVIISNNADLRKGWN